MQFLQYEIDAVAGSSVVVQLDRAANVRLMDPTNFTRFRRGQPHQYFGGQQVRSPARLAVPHTGRWIVTIDLGGRGGQVHASVSVVP